MKKPSTNKHGTRYESPFLGPKDTAVTWTVEFYPTEKPNVDRQLHEARRKRNTTGTTRRTALPADWNGYEKVSSAQKRPAYHKACPQHLDKLFTTRTTTHFLPPSMVRQLLKAADMNRKWESGSVQFQHKHAPYLQQEMTLPLPRARKDAPSSHL